MSEILKSIKERARFIAICVLCVWVIIIGAIGDVFRSIALWNLKALNALMSEEEYQEIKRRHDK